MDVTRQHCKNVKRIYMDWLTQENPMSEETEGFMTVIQDLVTRILPEIYSNILFHIVVECK